MAPALSKPPRVDKGGYMRLVFSSVAALLLPSAPIGRSPRRRNSSRLAACLPPATPFPTCVRPNEAFSKRRVKGFSEYAAGRTSRAPYNVNLTIQPRTATRVGDWKSKNCPGRVPGTRSKTYHFSLHSFPMGHEEEKGLDSLASPSEQRQKDVFTALGHRRDAGGDSYLSRWWDFFTTDRPSGFRGAWFQELFGLAIGCAAATTSGVLFLYEGYGCRKLGLFIFTYAALALSSLTLGMMWSRIAPKLKRTSLPSQASSSEASAESSRSSDALQWLFDRWSTILVAICLALVLVGTIAEPRKEDSTCDFRTSRIIICVVGLLAMFRVMQVSRSVLGAGMLAPPAPSPSQVTLTRSETKQVESNGD